MKEHAHENAAKTEDFFHKDQETSTAATVAIVMDRIAEHGSKNILAIVLKICHIISKFQF